MSELFAAVTTTSTSTLVMSACTTSICMRDTVPGPASG